MIETPERRGEQTGFLLSDTLYQKVAGLYNAVAHTDNPDSYRETAMLYSAHFDMGVAVNILLNTVSDEEREEIFAGVSDLAAQADAVGELFPESLSDSATKAYGELTTSILWSFAALKMQGSKLSPSTLPLRSGKQVQVDGFTYQEALETTRELFAAVNKIVTAAGDSQATVTRVNQSGAYGMYRIGEDRDVLATIRLLGSTSHDPAIEYANSKGTEASIGYSVDLGRTLPSAYKNEQVDEFSLRIDNEGDELSLDVGSILGRPGTLGKRVAGLIAIGDAMRIKQDISPRQTASLNHNKNYFPKKLAGREAFAAIAAEVAASLENRRQSTRQLHAVRQLALKQTVGA